MDAVEKFADKLIRSGARFVPITEVLPDTPPRAALLGLAPGSCCFQSGGHSGSWGSGSSKTILALDPFEKFEAVGRKIRTSGRFGTTEFEGNPYSALADQLERYRIPSLPPRRGLPFFPGGALGYFSYESVRHLEPSVTGSPFSEPAFDAEFAFFEKAVLLDEEGGRTLLLSGFFPETETFESGMARARAGLESLRELCERARREASGPRHRASSTEVPVEAMTASFGRDRFQKAVREIKRNIREGEIFQAVLSERFTFPFDGDPIALFETLCGLNPARYQFYYPGLKRTHLGASPEMLLRIDDRQLETHPIAGTRPRGATPEEDRRKTQQLCRSPKERAEHLMLVDLARNDIGRVAEPGSVCVPRFMELVKYAEVMHLVSQVTGTLKADVRPIEALGSCFPAGTLSGAPKIRAMQLISRLEPEPRGFYGGAVVAAGFGGDLDSCISIRSIQLEAGQATLQAGAGIVADSDPDKEYAEIAHKSRSARKALAIP